MMLRLVQLLEAREVDPEQILDPTLSGEPQSRVSYADVDRAIERSAACLGAAGLGLALAQVRDDEAYGVAGLLLVASSSLRRGLSSAFAYQRVWGDGERFTIHATREGCQVRFRHPGRSGLARAVLAECALAEVMACARMLVQPDAAPIRVVFGHSNLGGDTLADYFGAAPYYDSGENAIVLSDGLVDHPLVLRGELFRSYFERQCEQAIRQLPSTQTLADTARRIIARALAAPFSISKVAAELKMTPRTLQRRLRAEGTTYQHLVDTVRRARAEELRQADYLRKEMAEHLGYSDPSGFVRARRRWRWE